MVQMAPQRSMIRLIRMERSATPEFEEKSNQIEVKDQGTQAPEPRQRMMMISMIRKMESPKENLRMIEKKQAIETIDFSTQLDESMLKQEEAPAPRIQKMSNPSIAIPEKKEDQSL